MLARNGFFAHPVLQAGGGAESRFAGTEGDGGTTPFPGPACERAEPATRTVCPFRLSHIRFAGDPCRLSRQGGRDSRAGTPRCPTARRTAKRLCPHAIGRASCRERVCQYG